MLQTHSEVFRYSLTIPAEKRIFAITMGPQEAFTVAKIQVLGGMAFRELPTHGDRFSALFRGVDSGDTT
jgi:hypothetical protein